MELQRATTAETGKEARHGTMFTSYSPGCKVELTVEYDASLNRLRLATRNGDCVWLSDWLEVSNQLRTEDMVQLIREGLRLWPLRIGSLLRGQKTTLTPLELAAWTIKTFEHCLA